MIGMSRAGLAERWTLFAGAFLSVVLGVALVQSSLLLLISAATLDPPAGLSPAERLAFDDNASAAVALLGVVLGGATFLAGFVISSTFAFTVAQRRRDLALLRLVGAGRGQVRRLLLGEAVLLGGVGAVAGIPAGLGVMAFQSWLLRRMEFVPAGFEARWRPWILAVSLGTGMLLAVAGVLVAARRAARVRPLEALRDSGDAARVMTVGRWIAGLIFLGGALALIIVAPHGGPSGGQAMALNVAMPAAVAVAALSPLVVPLLGRLLPSGGGVIGGLARANLWDGRRRSAAVAAPLIVLVALVVGNAGAGTSFTDSGIGELGRTTHADLVVEATGPVGGRIAATPGVAVASTETLLPAVVSVDEGDDVEKTGVQALVIDPADYAAVHSGGTAVAGLRGRAMAVGPGGEIPSRSSLPVTVAGVDLGEVPVVATMPPAMSGGAGLLLPPGLVPADQLTSAPTVSYVTLAAGADAGEVRAALTRIGTVSDFDRWLRADAEARARTNNKVMLVVLGLGGLYALIGVINSTVMGAATRRREFAEARVTGLTRAQVLGSALVESAAVTVSGLLLGGLAASGAFLAAVMTTKAVTGTATLSIPWTLIAAVGAVALLVTSVTSLITSWSATRRRPVTLLGARE